MAHEDAPGDRITDLLKHSPSGEPIALDRVFQLVYAELRRLAHAQLARQPAGRTITTTVLIHEAYLRLIDQRQAQFEDRAHFYAYAARVMRAVLVDAARARGSKKRGGEAVVMPLDGHDLPVEDQADLVLAVHEALGRLDVEDARLARLVECRFFGGLTDAETAEALGLSDRTVRREWIKARTWLRDTLGPA